MKTYLIQRNLPGAGKLTMAEKKAIAVRSCEVIEELGPENIKWHHTYVTDDNLWCIYSANDVQILIDHANKGPFPCENIREIHGTFSPATAEVEIEANA